MSQDAIPVKDETIVIKGLGFSISITNPGVRAIIVLILVLLFLVAIALILKVYLLPLMAGTPSKAFFSGVVGKIRSWCGKSSH